MTGKGKALTATALITSTVICGALGISESGILEPKETELVVRFSMEQVYNDSVGTDFIRHYYINNEEIYSGYSVNSYKDNIIDIEVVLIEDEEFPDTSSGNISIRVVDGETETISLILTEDNGRYKGNTAKINITAKIISRTIDKKK